MTEPIVFRFEAEIDQAVQQVERGLGQMREAYIDTGEALSATTIHSNAIGEFLGTVESELSSGIPRIAEKTRELAAAIASGSPDVPRILGELGAMRDGIINIITDTASQVAARSPQAFVPLKEAAQNLAVEVGAPLDKFVSSVATKTGEAATAGKRNIEGLKATIESLKGVDSANVGLSRMGTDLDAATAKFTRAAEAARSLNQAVAEGGRLTATQSRQLNDADVGRAENAKRGSNLGPYAMEPNLLGPGTRGTYDPDTGKLAAVFEGNVRLSQDEVRVREATLAEQRKQLQLQQQATAQEEALNALRAQAFAGLLEHAAAGGTNVKTNPEVQARAQKAVEKLPEHVLKVLSDPDKLQATLRDDPNYEAVGPRGVSGLYHIPGETDENGRPLAIPFRNATRALGRPGGSYFEQDPRYADYAINQSKRLREGPGSAEVNEATRLTNQANAKLAPTFGQMFAPRETADVEADLAEVTRQLTAARLRQRDDADLSAKREAAQAAKDLEADETTLKAELKRAQAVDAAAEAAAKSAQREAMGSYQENLRYSSDSARAAREKAAAKSDQREALGSYGTNIDATKERESDDARAARIRQQALAKAAPLLGQQGDVRPSKDIRPELEAAEQKYLDALLAAAEARDNEATFAAEALAEEAFLEQRQLAAELKRAEATEKDAENKKKHDELKASGDAKAAQRFAFGSYESNLRYSSPAETARRKREEEGYNPNAGKDQRVAFGSYGENIAATKEREAADAAREKMLARTRQSVAEASYSDNLEATRAREAQEKKDAKPPTPAEEQRYALGSYRSNFEATKAREDAEAADRKVRDREAARLNSQSYAYGSYRPNIEATKQREADEKAAEAAAGRNERTNGRLDRKIAANADLSDSKLYGDDALKAERTAANQAYSAALNRARAETDEDTKRRLESEAELQKTMRNRIDAELRARNAAASKRDPAVVEAEALQREQSAVKVRKARLAGPSGDDADALDAKIAALKARELQHLEDYDAATDKAGRTAALEAANVAKAEREHAQQELRAAKAVADYADVQKDLAAKLEAGTAERVGSLIRDNASGKYYKNSGQEEENPLRIQAANNSANRGGGDHNGAPPGIFGAFYGAFSGKGYEQPASGGNPLVALAGSAGVLTRYGADGAAIYGVSKALHAVISDASAYQSAMIELNETNKEVGGGALDLGQAFQAGSQYLVNQVDALEVGRQAIARFGDEIKAGADKSAIFTDSVKQAGIAALVTGEDAVTAGGQIQIISKQFGMGAGGQSAVSDAIQTAGARYGVDKGALAKQAVDAGDLASVSGFDVNSAVSLIAATTADTGRTSSGADLARLLSKSGSPEFQKALAALNVRGGGTMFDKTKEAAANFQGLDPQQQQKIVTQMGGERTAAPILALFRNFNQVLADNADAWQHTGDAQKAADAQLNTIGGHMRTLGTTMKDIGTELGKSGVLDVLGVMFSIVQALAGAFDKLLHAVDAIPFHRQAIDALLLVGALKALSTFGGGSIAAGVGRLVPGGAAASTRVSSAVSGVAAGATSFYRNPGAAVRGARQSLATTGSNLLFGAPTASDAVLKSAANKRLANETLFNTTVERAKLARTEAEEAAVVSMEQGNISAKAAQAEIVAAKEAEVAAIEAATEARVAAEAEIVSVIEASALEEGAARTGGLMPALMAPVGAMGVIGAGVGAGIIVDKEFRSYQGQQKAKAATEDEATNSADASSAKGLTDEAGKLTSDAQATRKSSGGFFGTVTNAFGSLEHGIGKNRVIDGAITGLGDLVGIPHLGSVFKNVSPGTGEVAKEGENRAALLGDLAKNVQAGEDSYQKTSEAARGDAADVNMADISGGLQNLATKGRDARGQLDALNGSLDNFAATAAQGKSYLQAGQSDKISASIGAGIGAGLDQDRQLAHDAGHKGEANALGKLDDRQVATDEQNVANDFFKQSGLDKGGTASPEQIKALRDQLKDKLVQDMKDKGVSQKDIDAVMPQLTGEASMAVNQFVGNANPNAGQTLNADQIQQSRDAYIQDSEGVGQEAGAEATAKGGYGGEEGAKAKLKSLQDGYNKLLANGAKPEDLQPLADAITAATNDVQSQALAKLQSLDAVKEASVSQQDKAGQLKTKIADLQEQIDTPGIDATTKNTLTAEQTSAKQEAAFQDAVTTPNAQGDAALLPGDTVATAKNDLDKSKRTLDYMKAHGGAAEIAAAQADYNAKLYAWGQSQVTETNMLRDAAVAVGDKVGDDLAQAQDALDAAAKEHDPGKKAADLKAAAQKNAQAGLDASDIYSSQTMATIDPRDAIANAKGKLQGDANKLRTIKAVTPADAKAIADMQRTIAQDNIDIANAQLDAASAIEKANKDPRDLVGQAQADLDAAYRELQKAGPDAQKQAEARAHIRSAQIALNQQHIDEANAQRDASIDPSSALQGAAATIADTKANLSNDLPGTKKYYDDIKALKAAQLQYAEAQRAYSKLVEEGSLDLTNPINQAKSALDDANRKLAEDIKRGAGKDTIQADKNAITVQKNAEEAAVFQVSFDQIKVNMDLNRITIPQYIQNLQKLRASITDNTYQAQMQRNQIDEAIHQAYASGAGQFNLGDIKVPTVFQARSQALATGAETVQNIIDGAAKANASGEQYKNIFLPFNQALQGLSTQQAVTQLNSLQQAIAALAFEGTGANPGTATTNHIAINGTDTATILNYLKSILGASGANVNTLLNGRKV